MPGFDGQKLVSETYSRGRNEARIVITLEAKVTDEQLAELPAYQRDAKEFVKELARLSPDLLDELVSTLGVYGIEIGDTKIEALS